MRENALMHRKRRLRTLHRRRAGCSVRTEPEASRCHGDSTVGRTVWEVLCGPAAPPRRDPWGRGPIGGRRRRNWGTRRPSGSDQKGGARRRKPLKSRAGSGIACAAVIRTDRSERVRCPHATFPQHTVIGTGVGLQAAVS